LNHTRRSKVEGGKIPLDEYKRKRKFDSTPEPIGIEGDEEQRIFVVQEHHASHLHWDLRLSMNGVLKSWAVPKGVPLEENVKHLAVETEDHPLDYAGFEGEIPKGYGAGTVVIWDRGSYELLERTEEKIVVQFHGRQLDGRYALVRFGGREREKKNWLIMRTG
jgi:bifunctional non-homologous end joining protein LigD